MSSPYNPIDNTGIVVVDTSQIKSEVQQTYLTALGDDLYLGDESPQGVLISVQTAERVGAVSAVANAVNQINPNVSEGVFLDAICALSGIQRSPGTFSTFSVNPTVTGVPGTLIPAGSLAVTPQGDRFQTTASVAIPALGSITVPFIAVERGEVACPVDSLSIDVPIAGWETVTNTVAATPGEPVESDPQLRITRNNTLAFQAAAGREAIVSGVALQPGVFDVVSRDNDSNSPQIIDGVLLNANSVWVCVSGGDDTQIAEQLNASKNFGAPWQDNIPPATGVSINVIDPYNGQPNTILFDRPAAVPVAYQVTINSNGVSNAQSITRQAILDYAVGNIPALGKLGIGVDVSPFTATSAINSVSPAIEVLNVLVTLLSVVNFQPVTIPIPLTQLATVSASDITVVDVA